MIDRDEAFTIIKKYLKEKDNIRRAVAVEAVLRQLAKKLDKDVDIWGIAGLLHNLDYEYTDREPEKRGTVTAILLEGILSENIINAIKAINYTHTDYIPTTSLDKILIATDAVTDLIIKTSRLIPTKKVHDLDINVLAEKYLDENFEPSINRSKIELCVDAGIEVKDFLYISLETLKRVSMRVGL